MIARMQQTAETAKAEFQDPTPVVCAVVSPNGLSHYSIQVYTDRRIVSGRGDTPEAALADLRQKVEQPCPSCGRAK